MFTGLVETVGEIADRTATAGGSRVRIATRLAAELALGDSVAVNGVCLTVTAAAAGEIAAAVGPETARVTTLGSLTVGSLVNLERPLKADGRLGGHFVLGHVDAVGRVEELRPEADFSWLAVSFPLHLSRLFITKGSVAVDGISLTVAALHPDRFVVQLVPYTMEHTNLRRTRVHDAVNLECDVIGKYVARYEETRDR
jgi:riboflavin synthase